MSAATVGELLRTVRTALRPRLDAAAAALEARLLVGHVSGLDQLAQVRDPAAPIARSVAAEALALADRRSEGAPLAYLVGRREFFGHDFAVGPGVLVPRPESETLVEAALAQLPADRPARILDLGTGSGCLLLTVLAERPQAWGIGIDRSAEALAYASHNATALGVTARTALVRGEWCTALAGRFDVILANPPYVPSAAIPCLMEEVRRHEPHLALDGGDDGLDAYRQLLPSLTTHLVAGGLALFEIGGDQAAAVLDLAHAAGHDDVRLVQDLSGSDRCVAISGAA